MKQFASAEIKRRWIEEVMLDLQEGIASPEDRAALRDLLLEDAEARRFYLEANRMNCLLGMPDTVRAEEPPSGAARRTRLNIVLRMAAAAVLVPVVAGLWWTTSRRPEPLPPPATVNTVGDGLVRVACELHAVSPEGVEMKSGPLDREKYELRAGWVQLELPGKVKMVLEGPCAFRIGEGGMLSLLAGKAWVSCAGEATDFHLRTGADSELVTTGGEFGVEVDGKAVPKVAVFDGWVERRARQVPGSAIRFIAPQDIPQEHDPAARAGFMSATALSSGRWTAHLEAMLRRQDLAFYLPLAGLSPPDETLPNRAAVPGASDGRLHHAMPVSGRMEGKYSLLYDKAGDAVSASLAMPLAAGFTIALWLKVDRLSDPVTAIVDSDRWQAGAIHFQITGDGRLRLGIHGRGAFQTGPSLVQVGRWQFVAMTWKPEGGSFVWCDGQMHTTEQCPNGTPSSRAAPRFGAFQIGSWAMSAPEISPDSGSPILVTTDSPPPGPWITRHQRNFKGHIDEVMIFQRPLDPADLREIFENSRP